MSAAFATSDMGSPLWGKPNYMALREQLLNRLEADEGGRRCRLHVVEGSARRRRLNPLRPVDAERGVDRARNVFHVDRTALGPARICDIAARFVGAADDGAALDAAAGKDAGVHADVMLTSLARFGDRPGYAAELAHRDDERFVEQRPTRRVA